MKARTTILAAALVALTSACATNFTDYRMVYDNTGVNPAKLKKGEACVEQKFFGWAGDATVGAAAKHGNIKTVHYVEHTFVKKKNCTVVYGE